MKELKCVLKKGISKKSGLEYYYYEIYVCKGFVKKVFVHPFADSAEVALLTNILDK